MHNLNIVNGRIGMAYTGAKPWHGLGTHVETAMTSADAIKLANMDWTVEKRPLYFISTSPGAHRLAEGRYGVIRKDTSEFLGDVGSVYRPLQNKEAFSFFDAIVGEKLAIYHTVGALGKGERVWMLAKLPKEMTVAKGDKLEQFLLLTNSHDGSSAVEIMFTPIRVVCQNTLNMAFNEHGKRSKIRHTMSLGMNIDRVRKELGFAQEYFNTFEQLSKHLVSKQANAQMVERLLSSLGLSTEKGKESTRAENTRERIRILFERGKGNTLPAVKGSAWALLNGVVEYVDYFRPTKGEAEAGRANSLLFGSGATMKQTALDTLVELTK